MSMDNKSLYIFQSWVSLFVHSAMVWINWSLGWAGVDALWYTGHMIMFYEMFDLFVGWRGYWERDRLMLVHHAVTWAAGWTLLYFLGSDEEEIVMAVRDTMYWGLLSEVTTVFNAARIIANGWGESVGIIMRGVFAVVFCALRGVQTIGMGLEIWNYWHNRFVLFIIGFWTVFTLMNVFWMRQIVITFASKVGCDRGCGSYRRVKAD